jgi:hypothetical protein
MIICFLLKDISFFSYLFRDLLLLLLISWRGSLSCSWSRFVYWLNWLFCWLSRSILLLWLLLKLVIIISLGFLLCLGKILGLTRWLYMMNSLLGRPSSILDHLLFLRSGQCLGLRQFLTILSYHLLLVLVNL